MAKREAHCLVCGRKYIDYDAAPRFFCTVACEADAGAPVRGENPVHKIIGRGRAAKTLPRTSKEQASKKDISSK